MRRATRFAAGALILLGCGNAARSAAVHQDSRVVAAADPAVFSNSAPVYFLLPDRSDNGNPRNDTARGRPHDGAVLRSFEGGDLAGVLRKIEAGYFDSLG